MEIDELPHALTGAWATAAFGVRRRALALAALGLLAMAGGPVLPAADQTRPLYEAVGAWAGERFAAVGRAA